MQRRIVVHTSEGNRYVRDCELLRFDLPCDNYVRFLKLTTSKRWAKKFGPSDYDDTISGIHSSVAMGFYPQHKIQFAG
jgi:hypothetical protein